MRILRKSIVIQLLLFIAFLIMALNVGISHFMGEEWPWLSYVLLGAFVGFIAVGIKVYRNTDSRTSVITKRELDLIRYLTYGYFGLYVVQLILTAVIEDEGLLGVLVIIIMVLLIAISAFGAYILKRILG
ncbi:MAG: hypothetical protein ACLFTZ_02900 [Acholeplasmataceae bacterium]